MLTVNPCHLITHQTPSNPYGLSNNGIQIHLVSTVHCKKMRSIVGTDVDPCPATPEPRVHMVRIPETRNRSYGELDVLFEHRVPAWRLAKTQVDRKYNRLPSYWHIPLTHDFMDCRIQVG
jgi:hypothetical protein